ncbi:MAG: glycosyltransferase family A protein [Bacteroidota bacterium]
MQSSLAHPPIKVSVIIPCFNAEAFVAAAIDSALAQGDVVGELLLVDNNSTDETLAVLHTYRERFPERIHVLKATTQGAAAARNLGLLAARGEWIQFLDADDIILPSKLDHQLTLVDPATDWIIAAFWQEDARKRRTLSEVNPDPWRGLVYNGGTGMTHSNLFRRKILLAVGGMDEALPNNEDSDLYFRLLKNDASVRLDQDPRAVYRFRTGSRLTDITDGREILRVVEFCESVNEYLRHSRPAYWSEHRAFFRAALLRQITRLVRYDSRTARKVFARAFPEGVAWSAVRWSLLPAYALLYPLFGMAGVIAREKIRRRLKSD